MRLWKWLGLALCLGGYSLSGMAQDAAKGEALYKTCVQCHGDKGLGLESERAPRIAGQFDWYIVSQLILFQKKERVNEKMYPFIEKLSEQDFKDLAAYVSGLK